MVGASARGPVGAGPPDELLSTLTRDPWLRLMVACASVLLLVCALDLPGDHLRPVLSWTASVISLGCSSAAYFGTAARLRGPPARRFWLAMATTCGLIGAGSVVQLAVVVGGGSPTTATQLVPAAQALGGAGALVLILVMFTYPVPFTSKWAKLIFGLDMATVMTAAVAFGVFFGTTITMDVHNGVWNWALSIITGPVLSLMVVFSTTKLLLTGSAPFNRLAGLFGLAATTTLAISTGMAPTLSALEHQHWFAVLDVLANAFVVACTRSQQLAVTVSPGVSGPRRREYSVAPYVAVAVADVLMIAALVEQRLGVEEWIMVGSVTACTGLVIARQLTAFADNHRLLLERRELTAQLEQLAYHDPLTGLANRALFFQRLEDDLDAARSRAGTTAVILIDLDEFKPINDQLGHHAGDEVLIAVAQRMLDQVRESDTVARLGGDEFAVVLSATNEEFVAAVSRRISDAVGAPLDLAGRPVRVGCSVGIAVDTGGLVPAADLVRQADAAMYLVKGARKRAAQAQRGSGDQTSLTSRSAS